MRDGGTPFGGACPSPSISHRPRGAPVSVSARTRVRTSAAGRRAAGDDRELDGRGAPARDPRAQPSRQARCEALCERRRTLPPAWVEVRAAERASGCVWCHSLAALWAVTGMHEIRMGPPGVQQINRCSDLCKSAPRQDARKESRGVSEECCRAELRRSGPDHRSTDSGPGRCQALHRRVNQMKGRCILIVIGCAREPHKPGTRCI